MKKNIYLILFLIIGLCNSQAWTKSKASAKRNVKNNILTSKALPKVSIRVNGKLKYLGKIQFELYKSAYVERFHFAELEGKSIKRLLVFQFEHYLKGNDYKYKKHSNNLMELGGLEFARTSSLTHVKNVLEKWNGKGTENEYTYAFFDKKGYLYQNEIFGHRFMHVLDDLRHEFLILYYEPLEGLNLSLADLKQSPSFTYAALRPGFLEVAPERRDKYYLLKEFKARMLKSFEFLPGNN